MALNMPMSPLRRKHWFLILGFIVFIPFCFFVLFAVPDETSEQLLIQSIAEQQVKLEYLDSTYRTRQEDLRKLTEQIDLLSIQFMVEDNTSLLMPPAMLELKPEIKQLLKNMSGMAAAQGFNSRVTLRLPSSFSFLPHLLDDPSSLRLAYLMSRGRIGVSMVLGIPTVKREKQNYLMDTLQNLIDGMTLEESNDSLIVVFVAETDLEYVLQVAKDIELRFPAYVESGLIEVLSPSESYYPDFDKLKLTLGDAPERVKWRSKQNLDFAYLMSYSQTKGTFYVQLEDDILARPQYVSDMKKFAIEETSKMEPWFVLDFCQLGFIGKMFKTAELPWLITFFQMFYNDQPVDWLLDFLLNTKVCNIGKNQEICKKEKAKLWIHYNPSLFQHMGTHSSLNGKLQNLKDKQFGKVALFFPHSNPDAEITSGIKHYKQYSLKRAYLGETFFWGLLPQPGDQLIFKFSVPIPVKKFYFKSGNAEHPSDKFYNTTVEVLPVGLPNPNNLALLSNITNDGYVVVVLRRTNLKKTAIPSMKLPKVIHGTTAKPSGCAASSSREDRLDLRNRVKVASCDTPVTEEVVHNLENTEVDPLISEEEVVAANALLSLMHEGTSVTNQKTFHDFSVQVNTPNKLTLCNFITSNSSLITLTGLNSQQMLDKIVESVCLIYKDQRIHKLSVKERVILTFVKLKWNLSYSILAIFFGLTPTLCRTYLLRMIKLLSSVLKAVIEFPSMDEVRQNMPVCFEGFTDTQIVLDCTEIYTQIPKCLCCRIRFYSHYKSAQTVKFMTGVSPAGLITFISKPYGGRASDKMIFENSNLIDKLEEKSGIMVDKGFLIDTICLEHNIKLYRPPFLRSKKQLDEDESRYNTKIAAARVHIERTNQRIKIFNVLSGKLPWGLVHCVEDIFIIACAVTNLSAPILADDKFIK